MQSQDTNETRSGNFPVIGRTTILILSGMLFWFFFVTDAGSISAKLALCGGVAGIVGYLGLLFTTRKSTTGDRLTS